MRKRDGRNPFSQCIGCGPVRYLSCTLTPLISPRVVQCTRTKYIQQSGISQSSLVPQSRAAHLVYPTHLRANRLPHTSLSSLYTNAGQAVELDRILKVEQNFPQKSPNGGIEVYDSPLSGVTSRSGNLRSFWMVFENLHQSQIDQISPEELMAFASWSYEAYLLPLKSSASSQTFANRCRLLANTMKMLDDSPLKKCTSQGGSYAEWTTYLSMQALILSGELEAAVDMLLISLITSQERISPQHIQTLRQLFIAFSYRSPADALEILGKFWLKFHRVLGTHGPENCLYSVVEEFRSTMEATFGTLKEATYLLQSVNEPSLQQIGTSLVAFIYGKQESAIDMLQTYQYFVTCQFSMTWETHIRFFTILLSKHAHVLAYFLWKDTSSHLQNEGSIHGDNLPDVSPVPELTPFNDWESLRDRLPDLTQVYLKTCIDNSPQSLGKLAALSNGEMSLDALLAIMERSKLLDLANMVIDKSRIRSGLATNAHAKGFADFLDHIMKQVSIGPLETSQLNVNVFKWRSWTLRGDLSAVGDSLAQTLRYSPGIPDVRIIRAMTDLFVAAEDLYDLSTAFEYLMLFWKPVYMLLERSGEQFHKEKEKTEFQRAIFNAFAAVEEPLPWIVNLPETSEAKQNAACIFFTILCHRGDTNRIWNLFQGLQSYRVFLSFQEHVRLMQMFMACRETELATKVHDSLQVHFKDKVIDPEKRTRNELHTSLMLASQLGDWEEAQEHFDVMVKRGFADTGARLRLLHAYASVGDTARTRELFSKFYPVGGLQKPTLREFRTMIYAHIRAGDIQGINGWLEQMSKAGIQPTAEIYNMMLLAFAKLQDLGAATAILNRMYQNKVKPDKFAFTTIISIMADRKDPVAAERIYQRAIKDGVVPDTVMNIALMDAHIEAGSWRGAIRVFDYINHTRLDGSRDSTRLFNALLKAYVLIGAPFSVVSALFQRMQREKLTPNIITYSLVIQSACDSGQMDIARNLFNEFDSKPVFGKRKTHVDSYMLTILMAGYLRNGNSAMAKSIYDDMQTRGLQPDAVTFGIIINSFANERSAESLAIAEEFMRGLIKADDKDKLWLVSNQGGRPRALETIFTPLLTIYGQDMDIRSVERLFDSMLALGGEPTMVALNVLMDAYRRVGNLESVEQIWGEAVEVAKRSLYKGLFESLGPETVQSGKAQDQTSEEPSNTLHHNENCLCLSLSIYINTLSAAGRHIEIAKVWRQVRDWGFAFDAHNWNHLAVALVRAGEVERAFEIVERVLLPYSLQNRRILRSRRKKPQTPLSFFDDTVPLPQDVRHLASEQRPISTVSVRGKVKKSNQKKPEAETEAEVESDVKQVTPMRVKTRRIQVVESSTRNEMWLSSPEHDYAQPLYELQQMSAHFQGWRTHLRVLDALGWALETLKSGRRVLPMGGEAQHDRVVSGNEEREDEPLGARKTLEWISTSYPRAMMMVNMHVLGDKYKPPF